jgi:Transcription elongation factor, GreA/GreB, C-term
MSHSGQLSEMRDDRSVWIVGVPEEGAKATTHRYHRGDCYVLDQVGNRGRTQKVALAELPEGYAPCQICAPGSRSSTAASGGRPSGKAQRSPGVQPGHLVDVVDVDTGLVSTYRIASSHRPRDSGEISPGSPLGAALIGKAARAVVEFTQPKGGSRKLQILRFEPGAD